MKTALIFMVPHLSHFYPTFGLARTLRQLGLRVVYAGPPSYREMLKEEGFELQPVRYASEFVIRRFSVAVGLFIKTLLDASFTRSRFREFLKNVWEVENLMRTTDPDVVFLDDTLGHYYACMKERTVVQVSTKLSPRKSPGIPPLNSFWIARGRLLDIVIAEWLWFWHVKSRQVRKSIERIVFMGKSDAIFYQRYFLKHGLRWSAIMDRNRSIYDGLKHHPALVLAPAGLEFLWRKPHADERHLHFAAQRTEPNLHSIAYQQVKQRLLHRKATKNDRIVFVALGTLSIATHKRSGRFLARVAEALGGLENVQALISTGGIDTGEKVQAPNLHYLPTVPQLDFLPYCDMMITHGGLGTVKECLEAGVPMLVCPLNRGIDQPGNSARVVQHRWGLQGRISSSAMQIRQKTLAVLNSSARKNCLATRRSLALENSSQSVEALLQRLGVLEKDSVESTISFVSL